MNSWNHKIKSVRVKVLSFGLAILFGFSNLFTIPYAIAQEDPGQSTKQIMLATQALEVHNGEKLLPGETDLQKAEVLQISTSEVEVQDQQRVADWVIQNQKARAQDGNGNVSFILYKEGGILSESIKQGSEELSKVGVVAIEVPKTVAEATPASTNLGPWSVSSMKNAGLLVSVGLTSVSGSVYFATHEVGPAALAATMSFGFQLIGNRFAKQQLQFFNSGGQLLEKMAMKVSNLSEKGKLAVNELGRWVNGYLYNVFGTILFAAALSSAPLPSDLASAAKFADFVGTTALFYLFADNSWDMSFAKLMQEAEKNKDERRIKTLLFMKYSKSTFVTLLAPLMFIPELRSTAMIGLGVFGTLGLIANKYPQPFVNLADLALSRLEKSRIFASAAALTCKSLFKSR